MPESNRMFDLITPFIEEVQAIETMLNDLREKRDVDNAEGLQLEGVGDIVDLPRPSGMNDDDYRAALRLKSTLNLSAGQPELLIAFVKDFTGANVEYREPWPGYFVMYVLAPCDFTRLRQNLKTLAPVGGGFDIIFVNPDVPTFNFANEGGFSSPGYGFLELDYDEETYSYTAGCLTELY